MSGGDVNVAGLRSTVALTLAEIARTQSALALARDRSQQARDILRAGTQGSSRDETSTAATSLLAVEELVQQCLNASLLAVEQLRSWAETL